MTPGAPVKPTVRWRFVSDDGGGWSWWEVNGARISVVDDPKTSRKGKADLLEERVLRIVRKK